MTSPVFLSPEQAFTLRAQYGTPLYIYDEKTLSAQADQVLVGVGMFFFNEMNVVCCYEFRICFPGQLDQFCILQLLFGVSVGTGAGFVGFVALKL